jgi:DNA-binding CsgD family transcriptional regulator
MRGERFCSPLVAEFLEQTTGPLRITPEERCTLALLGEGVLDSFTLAERVGVHPSAAQKQMSALRNKTRRFSREELAAWYQRHGPRLTPEGTLMPITRVQA